MQRRNLSSTPKRAVFGAGYLDSSMSPIYDAASPEQQEWGLPCSPLAQAMASHRGAASPAFSASVAAATSPDESFYNYPGRRLICKRQLDMDEAENLNVLDGSQKLPMPTERLKMKSSYVNYNADASQRKVHGKILVQGPRTFHKYVPQWVMHCYDDAPEMFKWAMMYYFKKVKWPPENLIPEWYRDDLERDRIDMAAYQTTCGFAPVWMFLMNNMVNAGQIEQRFLDRCVDMFFQDDEWPAIATLPDEFQEECDKNKIDDYTYFDSDD